MSKRFETAVGSCVLCTGSNAHHFEANLLLGPAMTILIPRGSDHIETIVYIPTTNIAKCFGMVSVPSPVRF